MADVAARSTAPLGDAEPPALDTPPSPAVGQPASPADPAPSADPASPDAGELRSGSALVRATKPFSEEDPALTWRLFATTMLVFTATTGVAVAAPFWPIQLAASVLAGLVTVRIFIFYHDWMHGAVFRKSPAGQLIMRLFGLYILTPPSVWKQTHDYHHQNNAKMTGAAIGSYPVVTTRMWRHMTPSQRRWYAFARHPLTMLFGYFTLFLAGMIFSAFLRDPRKHWQAVPALVVHFGAMGLAWAVFGASGAFFGVLLPVMVSTAVGSYLFYAQHNFPDIALMDRSKWSYHFAALRSSSMFDMNPLMHWLTGNIGYHHVHHLNHKIPFYRLPEAMAAMPELQQPGRTSWHPRDIAACLRLKLWDPREKRLVGWDHLTTPRES